MLASGDAVGKKKDLGVFVGHRLASMVEVEGRPTNLDAVVPGRR